MGDLSDKMQILSDAVRDMSGQNFNLETVPDDKLGVMVDALAALTQTDPFLIKTAEYDKGELVSLFTQASAFHNEMLEAVSKIDNLDVYRGSELRNGTFMSVESLKARQQLACESMNRLASGIRERAHLKVQLKALSVTPS